DLQKHTHQCPRFRIAGMSRPSIARDEKARLETLPEIFATLSSEIERMSADVQSLETKCKQILQRSLTDAAVAVDDQLKKSVVAAEEAVRRQILTELRAKYGRELELALTEKALIERRLRAATQQFDQEKESWAAKLDETQQTATKLQVDLEQTRTERS